MPSYRRRHACASIDGPRRRMAALRRRRAAAEQIRRPAQLPYGGAGDTGPGRLPISDTGNLSFRYRAALDSPPGGGRPASRGETPRPSIFTFLTGFFAAFLSFYRLCYAFFTASL